MPFCAALDVAMEKTALCVLDQEGQVVLEINVSSDPSAIADRLEPYQDALSGLAWKPDRCWYGWFAAWPIAALCLMHADAVEEEMAKRLGERTQGATEGLPPDPRGDFGREVTISPHQPLSH